MLLASGLLGVVQWLLSLIFNDGAYETNASASWEFLLAPAFDQSVEYIVFFSIGIVAKQSNWMQDFEQLSNRSVWVCRGLTVACSCLLFLPSPRYEQDGAPQLLIDLLYQLLRCSYCVAVSVSLLDFFRKHVGSPGGGVRQFLISHSFAVYLVHYPFVVACTWAYSLVLAHLGQDFVWTNAQPCYLRLHCTKAQMTIHPMSSTELDSEALLWIGCGLCFLVTNAVAWPLSWCLRKLPGLNKIL